MILRMNHQALYAPIPIFQRSSNVPRGTFSKDQHLFQYSDVSRGTFLRKNALRHHPFDFSILVRSKNSLHILDSNRQELFFFARLVVRNLMPGSQAPNTMRRLKDQLLFQCSNVPRGTFSREALQKKVFYSLKPYQHDPQNESARSPFKYSHLPAIFKCSTWNIFKKNPLRHHPFDFSILVRSKNSLHILDSNRQKLFFFARLVV
jgi:hypothetical protein